MRRFLKYLAITQSTSRNGVYLSLPYPENTYHIKIHTKFSDKRKSQLKKTFTKPFQPYTSSKKKSPEL